jgi:hypothetical protein
MTAELAGRGIITILGYHYIYNHYKIIHLLCFLFRSLRWIYSLKLGAIRRIVDFND